MPLNIFNKIGLFHGDFCPVEDINTSTELFQRVQVAAAADQATIKSVDGSALSNLVQYSGDGIFFILDLEAYRCLTVELLAADDVSLVSGYAGSGLLGDGEAVLVGNDHAIANHLGCEGAFEHGAF